MENIFKIFYLTVNVFGRLYDIFCQGNKTRILFSIVKSNKVFKNKQIICSTHHHLTDPAETYVRIATTQTSEYFFKCVVMKKKEECNEK